MKIFAAKRLLLKCLLIYLIIASLFMSLPAQGWSMFLTAKPIIENGGEITVVRKTLESSMLEQRLIDLGLPRHEARARLAKLSNEQIHHFASNLDSLQAGADGPDALLVMFLAAVIVIAVLQLTGNTVMVR